MIHDRTQLTAILIAVFTLGLTPGTAGARTAFETIFDEYDAIRVALVKDDDTVAKEKANTIRAVAVALEESFTADQAGVPAGRREDLSIVLGNIADAAIAMEKAQELAAVREAFGDLSNGLVRYRNMLSGNKPMQAYCSMVKKTWLQPDGKLGNPYLGSEMPTCGEVVDKATAASRPSRGHDMSGSTMGGGGHHGH